jgi:hypothetical protein
MNGLIAIEEAVQLPELAHEARNHAPGKAADRLAKNLVDIHEQRLQAMNEYGVEMQVSPLKPTKLMLGIIADFTWTSGIVRSRCGGSSRSKQVAYGPTRSGLTGVIITSLTKSPRILNDLLHSVH